MRPEELAAAKCPVCANTTLTLEWRMKARPLGTFSLAGTTPKFSATQAPFLVCTTEGCDFEEEGHL